MSEIISPWIVLLVFFGAQLLAAYAGDFFRRKIRPLREEERADFDVVRAATLTLLALLIGFSAAMAVTRYDQRRNYEEAEANAIGTQYLRADLLPEEDAAKLRDLLSRYVEQRIAFYTARDDGQVAQIATQTGKLQAELWSTVVRATTKGEQTAVIALAVAGMNDVLNSQGYTQAAWWNRVPIAVWGLLGLIAVSCNLLVGYGEYRQSFFTLVLSLIVSISFFSIADIDSPRTG